MKAWTLARRGLAREWRGGELRVLALALAVAVAAVSAVGLFTDRIAAVMTHQAAELLAADLVVQSGRGIDPAWTARAEELGLSHTRTATFRSMLLGERGMQLVEVKAAAEGYPLRGTLRTAGEPYGTNTPASGPPRPGTVWLDPRLFHLLGTAVGERVQLGDAKPRVARVLSFEPDRGGQLFSIGPRVLMHYDDLERTGLIATGSLVTYRLLLAGGADKLRLFRRWVDERLEPGERLLGVRDARPELRLALDRAHRFLGLAALVSVLLAGVAVAISARQYARRHLDTAAVLRCLGAGSRLIVSAFVIRLAIVGALASLAGLLGGFAAQAGLAAILGGLFAQALPAPSAWPAIQGALTGLVALAGFALPPVLSLGQVPPLRVLRREDTPVRPGGRVLYVVAATALVLLTAWYAGDLRLTAIVLGGAAGALLVLAASARLLVASLGVFRERAGAAWRFGLANVARRPLTSVLQVVAFGIGAMALLLLALVRGDLLEQWQDRLPADAPNRFLIDIQAGQVEPLRRFFAGHGVAVPVFHPMVKARLVAIDGRPVDVSSYDNPRAKRLVNREFNLSRAESVQVDNRIAAGTFWAPGTARDQWSVETGIAETLGIELGSVLRFRVGGREVAGPVTSLRAVDWDSFRVNFFVLAPPATLEGAPASFITAFHLPHERSGVLTGLVRKFPNVTVIDVEAVMSRVRSIIERVSQGIEFVFAFTLVAGVVVLLAAIQASREERSREAAILRALGASRRQLVVGAAVEFAALGALAGLLAAFAATAAGFVAATQLFGLGFPFDPGVWMWGLFGGALGVGAAGTLGVRRILATPPMRVLQEVW